MVGDTLSNVCLDWELRRFSTDLALGFQNISDIFGSTRSTVFSPFQVFSTLRVFSTLQVFTLLLSILGQMEIYWKVTEKGIFSRQPSLEKLLLQN